MTGKINIHVSGSGVSFGNVVQGSHNSVSSDQITAAGQTFAREAEELRKQLGVNSEQLTLLLREVEALQECVRAGERESTLSERLRALVAKFSWATPALKALAVQLVPMVARAVFGA